MTTTLTTNKIAAAVVGLALAFTFAVATPAKAQTVAELQAQIQQLLAMIAQLQGGSSTTTGGSCTGFTFTRNHTLGNTGGEVMEIQKFLNKSTDTQVASTGAGSPGKESSYFGPATKAAVIKFQNKYAADILTPVGLTKGTGTWGAATRAQANKLNANCGTGTGTGTGTTTTTTGGALMVSAAAQPANSLAVKGASRVPFTNFTLTNTSSAAVTVNGVTVERTGFAQDTVFSGVVLIDETGTQLGVQRTLNSNHQVKAGDPFTINPGQTKTITVAGNIDSLLTDKNGQVVSLSVIGIDTTATVSGSLPITGASHTTNNTLTIGSLSAEIGAADPRGAVSKEIGTTGYTGAAITLTAGSAEDVSVKSIRWNQSGSASASDLANVKTVVDGTEYPMTVSADGKYYTANFGSGVDIQKGFTKEFTVKFDIIGGTNRKASWDLYRATDVYAVGKTYGYGVTPTQDDSGSASSAATTLTAGSPFFNGSEISISAGSVTSVSRASEVPSQNVAENVANQPVGGFVIDIKGEPIQVQQMIFTFDVTSGVANAADLTNVTLVNENGAVVAGPVDGVASGAKVTFTDTVTFPTGRHVYTIKGKYGTDFANGDTVQASTTPTTDWSNITGAQTGDTITLANGEVTSNVMTVKSAAMTVTVGSSPAAQNVVAGVTGFTAANVQFDATQSGEDIKYTSAQFQYTDNMTTDVTNCFAYDGATRLNNTAVNPTGTGEDTFTFDNNLLVPKGTIKTIAIKCDIPGNATADDTFSYGIDSGDTITGTGLGSSQTVTATITSAAGQTMTIASGGALTVSKDSTSPAYSLAAGGTTGVTLGVLRFTGTNEDMRLDRVALQLSNTASSSPANLTQVTLWDGATQVGTAIFSGSNRNATSTLTGTVTIPANGYKLITVKGDLTAIGTGYAGTQGALIQVDYDDADSTGTRAVGVASGSTINRTSSADTAVDGVRVFRSVPTVAKLSVPTTTLTSGTMDLYRFSISADAKGDIGLFQLVANIATSTGSAANGTTSVTNLKLYAYSDSGFSSAVAGFSDGQVITTITDLASSGDTELQLSSVLQIPAGQTRYFKLVGDVTGTAGTSNWSGSVTTRISGDSAYLAGATVDGLLETAATVDGLTDDDFIWSPNATTTSGTGNQDWTNGYAVAGLPSGGTDAVTISK